MGLFRDWIRGAKRIEELEAALTGEKEVVNEQRRDLSVCVSEQNRLRTENTVLREQVAASQRFLEAGERDQARLEAKIELLEDLLTDARKREVEHAGLVARLVAIERTNATYQATTQWAVAHINSIAIERGSLIDRLDDRRGIHPVPQFQLETPDVTMDPPAGPIGVAPNIMGQPIPEGETAGDVINRLRAKRDREASQQPTSPADLVKAAADLFEEVPEGAASPDAPATDPFSDLELP